MEPGFIYCNLCHAGIPESLWERHVQSHAAQEGGRLPDMPGIASRNPQIMLGILSITLIVIAILVFATLTRIVG